MGKHQLLSLIIAGCALEFLYLIYFLKHFPLWQYASLNTELGALTNYSGMAMWAFVGVVTLSFVLFGYAFFVLSHIRASRYALGIILGFGTFFAVTLSLAYPVTSQEVYATVSQNKLLMTYHTNPLTVAPAEYAQDPLMQIAGQMMRYPSSYGPIGIVINAVPSIIGGENLFANLLALKLFFSAFLMGCAYLVYLIVKNRSPQQALAAALFVSWNPFLLFEVSVNGHNDIVMMFVALLGLLFFFRGRILLGTTVILISALVKYATLLLFPLVLVYAFRSLATNREKTRYLVASFILGSGIVIISYFPFWEGSATFAGCVVWITHHLQSFSSLLTNELSNIFTFTTAQWTSWFIFLCIFLFLLVSARKSEASLIRASFFSLFFFLLFGVSYFHVWYGIWPIVLAALLSRKSDSVTAIVFAYSLMISAILFSYIWMWFDARNPYTFAWLDTISCLVLFGPALFILVGFLIRDRFFAKRT